MPRSILYYPYINIHDGIWLRNAILYWDKISSIVPDAYRTNHSPIITMLQQEDIYRPTYTSSLLYSHENKEALNDFQNEVISKLELLIQAFQYGTKRPEMISEESSPLLHSRKMNQYLYDYMSNNELVRIHPTRNWLLVEKNTADIYMTTLAEYLAKVSETPTVIGTDTSFHFEETYLRSPIGRENLCFSVSLQEAMPTPNPDIPLHRLITFRTRRFQELQQLRNKLNLLEDSLSVCSSLEEMRYRINTFKDECSSALDDYKQLLHDARLEFTLQSMKSLFTTSTPGALTALIPTEAAIPAWITIALLATGGVLGLSCSFVQYRKSVNEMRHNSGFAYLYEATHANLINPT